MELAVFILAHEGDDPAQLALERDRYAGAVEDFDLALTTLEVRRKLKAKVPEWFAVPSLRYPLRLSGEQCSSSATARYKARVAYGAGVTRQPTKKAENVGRHVQADSVAYENGEKRGLGRLADLTGGLGVDCWAFAQVFGEVLYNEMRPELAQAAAFNFQELGLDNVWVRNCELLPGRLAQVLDGFSPDVIYLDPARRASDGRKVFRLEDCQPDVLQLLPELLAACPTLLLKLSPMADISLVCKQLGNVREVHVVAADGECKELLLLLEQGYVGPMDTFIVEDGAVMEVDQVQPLFGPGPISCGGPGPVSVASVGIGGILDGPGPGDKSGPGPKESWTRSGGEGVPSGKILFEPGKALLKAGAFDLPCRFGLEKLGRHTHLYVGEAVPEELMPFGKVFGILEILPLNKASFKEVGLRYPSAEVTARNIPLSSEALKAKLRVRSGGGIHIFGVHIDFLDGNYLLIGQNP